MAGTKFSAFTTGAVVDTTFIVGYDGDAGTNNRYTLAQLATGLQPSLTQSFIVACSDETTALTTGAAKATFRMPYAFTLTAVRASLTTAGSGIGGTTIDVNLNGSSIFTTTLLTIAAGDKTSTSTTPPNITTTALTDDGEITIDLDGISSGAVETGLKVTLIGYKTP